MGDKDGQDDLTALESALLVRGENTDVFFWNKPANSHQTVWNLRNFYQCPYQIY